MRGPIWLLGAAGVLVCGWAEPARACAPAMHPGDMVTIAAEEALIVWDAATRREHFIRRADFRTDADDFGFLVPTPTQPELGEVDNDVFARLSDAVLPEVEYTTGYVPLTCLTAPFMLLMATARMDEAVAVAPEGGGVQVLDTARVAGLDAVVLRASDAEALRQWLEDHGYATREALTGWLTPYVEAGYAITAFKIAKDADAGDVRTRAVRMSFAAERPFYPYREPPDHPETSGRSLRVFLVTAGRMDGTVGDDAWVGALEYARPLAASGVSLAGVVPGVPDGAWLSSFRDSSAVRARGGDLFFARGEDQGEVVPPPIEIETDEVPIPIPVEPVLLGGAWWWWRKRKKARVAAAVSPAPRSG